jgi:hypothetical protein
VLIPLGSALAAAVASFIGISATLIGSELISVACIAVLLAQPSVWALTREPEPAPA